MIEGDREGNTIEDEGLEGTIAKPNALLMLQEYGELHSREPQTGLFASLKSRKTASLSNPYLEMVARNIQPRWRQLARILGFKDDDCEEFESGDNSVGPWWPSFRMLDAFRAKLNETEARNGKGILADAIRMLNEDKNH